MRLIKSRGKKQAAMTLNRVKRGDLNIQNRQYERASFKHAAQCGCSSSPLARRGERGWGRVGERAESSKTTSLIKDQEISNRRLAKPNQAALGIQTRHDQLFHVKHRHLGRQSGNLIGRMLAFHRQPEPFLRQCVSR